MHQQHLEAKKIKLLDMRDRLRSEIHSRAQTVNEQLQPPGVVSDLPTHNADHDVEGLGTELATGAVQQDALVAVEAALDRIDDGSYGKCESCGQMISEERLEAIPYTPYCIGCERRHEAE